MSLAKLKKKIEEQKKGRSINTNPISTDGIGQTRKITPTLVKPIQKAQPAVKEEKPVFSEQPIPDGYSALGKNDVDKLMWLKDQIIKTGKCAFDYETDGDVDDETIDPQDHKVVGVSIAYKKGMAVYLPMGHKPYAANWDTKWLVENFLKPILEHPDVLVIAHNIKAEYQWSILMGIDLFPKACNKMVRDTMLMVKNAALPQTLYETDDGWDVAVGLKPATKALLADENGMINGIIHVDEIKSFKETVGVITWEEPTGEYYKSGKKKGQPKTVTKQRHRRFSELPIDEKTIKYACFDADGALSLYEYLEPICEAEGILDVILELDNPNVMVMGKYELSGWHVSKEKLLKLKKVADIALNGGDPKDKGNEEYRGLIQDLIDKWTPGAEAWAGFEALLYDALVDMVQDKAEISEDGEVIVPAGVYGMGEWRGEPVALEIKEARPFSWGSTKHKQWLFYHVLRMDTRGIERSKKTGLPSTNADTIDRLISAYGEQSQFMKYLKEKAKYDKILSTYVEGMLPYCREDTGKIHTQLNLVSTWRLSSKKPNLQNIPRADNDPMGIRGVFVAPIYDPNADYSHLNPFTKPVHIITEKKLSGLTWYISADYSQIELKVLAWYANELGMIQTLATGGDLHSWVAHRVFKLDCPVEEVKERYKPYRYRAKKVNFGLVYGMTEYGLAKDPKMGMTVEQAKQFIEDYMNTFPGVREYARSMIAFARKHGYVETMFRHRRPIPDINHPNKWVRQSAENKAMNTPIQGSAADIIRLAMVNMEKEAPIWYRGVMQIHDELQAEVPVEYGIEGARFMKEIMERPIEGFTELMPITVEPAIGATWDTALDLHFKPDGTAYVKPKKEKKEPTDVTYDMIAPYEKWYKLAGIEIA